MPPCRQATSVGALIHYAHRHLGSELTLCIWLSQNARLTVSYHNKAFSCGRRFFPLYSHIETLAIAIVKQLRNRYKVILLHAKIGDGTLLHLL
mgnify:CR=1 FL=1